MEILKILLKKIKGKNKEISKGRETPSIIQSTKYEVGKIYQLSLPGSWYTGLPALCVNVDEEKQIVNFMEPFPNTKSDLKSREIISDGFSYISIDNNERYNVLHVFSPYFPRLMPRIASPNSAKSLRRNIERLFYEDYIIELKGVAV